jgi:hypothetical protein
MKVKKQIHLLNNLICLVEDADEYNRYPILLDSSNIPYDNLQLQQTYNIDDLPMDDNEEIYLVSFISYINTFNLLFLLGTL